MWTDDKIILLEDVSAPLPLAGSAGDVKIIDTDVPLFYAKQAVKAGIARQVETEEDIESTRAGIRPKYPPPAPKPEPIVKTKPVYQIIFLDDVSAPPPMAARAGEVRIVGKTIKHYYARQAIKGGLARRVETDLDVYEVLYEMGRMDKKTIEKHRKESKKNVTDGKGDKAGRRKSTDRG